MKQDIDRQITTCTAVDTEFTTEPESYDSAFQMLRQDIEDDERIKAILEECVSGSARLVYYYPPCTAKVQDNWEWVAEILDGAIYLEKIGG